MAPAVPPGQTRQPLPVTTNYFSPTPQYPCPPFVYPGMDTSFSLSLPRDETRLMAEQNRRLTEAIARESGRLGSFIRRRVPDPGEAEDILQDVFFEQVGAWLFRVARYRR